MKGFNFEKNLNHQSHAVDSTIGVFLNIPFVKPTEADKNYINPAFDFQTGNTYPNNIRTIKENHQSHAVDSTISVFKDIFLIQPALS